jgi:hypothetical protein
MAKMERTLRGDFNDILQRIENGIIKGSVSATLEDSSDFSDGSSRCSVRVFERFSALGSNRVSLSVTLFEGRDGTIRLSAITSGGSQAMFFKINTFGEQAFLDKLEDVLQ